MNRLSRILRSVRSRSSALVDQLGSVNPSSRTDSLPPCLQFYFQTNETELKFYTGGLGDEMMARQIGNAFSAYVEREGDPKLGSVTVIQGGYGPFCDCEVGEVNAYWWYSFGPTDREPDRFHDEVLVPNIEVDIDVVLCGSKRIQEEADQLGYDTIYFPIGVHGFGPLNIDREGFGYAGSEGHKGKEKEEIILGDYRDLPDFEWVTEFRTPEALNLWYNTRFITFGLTKDGQREWGVVNSRVFEALGSGTPFIIESHPKLNQVLGFDYPYQASSKAEVREFVTEFQTNPRDTLAEFQSYANMIRENHDYVVRLDNLFSNL